MSRFVTAELDILVYWMLERDRIRAKKEAGEPKPWTENPLLRDYRWCNVRRMDDRVSRWLFEHWYGDRHDPDYQLLDATWGRLINWPDALAEFSDTRNPSDARPILAARRDRGDKVFTGAYVIPGVPGKNKVDSICDLVAAVSIKAEAITDCPTMRDTWSALLAFDGLGSFLAGQIVADLAFQGVGLQWPDRATWAPIGPGSARGINRIFGRWKDKAVTQEEFDHLLPILMAELRVLGFGGFIVRRRLETLRADRQLEAMDIQGCLCEFDKYRRLTLGEGKVRNTYNGNANPQESLL